MNRVLVGGLALLTVVFVIVSSCEIGRRIVEQHSRAVEYDELVARYYVETDRGPLLNGWPADYRLTKPRPVDPFSWQGLPNLAMVVCFYLCLQSFLLWLVGTAIDETF